MAIYNPLALSYRDPSTGLYSQGPADVQYVAAWVLMFTIAREVLMRCVFAPLASMSCWPTSMNRQQVIRFSEQGWSLTYYLIFWSLGFYIMQNSTYKNINAKECWQGYPHDRLTATVKWYYLSQIACWLQQIIVLNMEKRRKDHYRMLTHHLVTTALITLSYLCNFTRIGNVILVLTDLTDVFLPMAKMLKYTGYSTATDVVSIIFILAWIVTRHWYFGQMLYSVAFETVQMIPFDWRPEDGYFFNKVSYRAFVILLGVLQILFCAWLWTILSLAWSVVSGAGADDERSDDEGEEDESSPASQEMKKKKRKEI